MVWLHAPTELHRRAEGDRVSLRAQLGRLLGTSKRKTVRLVLHCRKVDSCEVAFEPWGTIETLRADDTFTVEVAGPGDGMIEVDYRPTGISIWGWNDADTMSAWSKNAGPLNI